MGMALVKAEDLKAQVQGFAALPAVRQIGLMIGLAASIALGVAVVLWSQSPGYSLLFANLPPQELAEVARQLDEANVPYQLEHGSNAILVPADRVHKLRMKLAAQGLPQAPEGGYDLLDKDPGFGVSRFRERILYQRALEGELARTIASLAAVQAARVHLAIPKQSVFVRDRASPRASVLVQLRPGARLKEDQVSGIVNLLASSVPELKPEGVTVVDQKGRLLNDHERDEKLALSTEQFEYNRKVEEAYRKRIMEILAPIVGPAGVRAEVTAELDFTRAEETREQYRPQRDAIRSEQIRESLTVEGEARGVPGALTNQPPRGGTLSTTEGEQANARDKSKEVVRNYELDRTISHSRFAPGRVKRLSVAVMLDYRKKLGDDGKIEQVPLSDEELARLTELVKKAVGFDPQRNDSINLVAMPFQADALAAPLEEPPLWQQPWVWELAKPVLGALFVLLLSLGVLRPTLKNLARHGHIIESEANAQRLPGPEGAGDLAQLPGPEGAAAEAGGDLVARAGDDEDQEEDEEAESEARPRPTVEDARTLVQQDPRRVAQLVREWVSADE